MSSIRPWRDIVRRQSRQIMVGSVPVGGDAPVTVQTMTNTPTADARATIDLIRRWIQAGAIFDGPDPKTPYAVKPATPETPPAAAPHPVRPPTAPSDRKPEDRPKTGSPEREKEKS